MKLGNFESCIAKKTTVPVIVNIFLHIATTIFIDLKVFMFHAKLILQRFTFFDSESECINVKLIVN